MSKIVHESSFLRLLDVCGILCNHNNVLDSSYNRVVYFEFGIKFIAPRAFRNNSS